MPGYGTQDDLRDRPIGDLLKQLSQETTALVRQELELAKAGAAVKQPPQRLGRNPDRPRLRAVLAHTSKRVIPRG